MYVQLFQAVSPAPGTYFGSAVRLADHGKEFTQGSIQAVVDATGITNSSVVDIQVSDDEVTPTHWTPIGGISLSSPTALWKDSNFQPRLLVNFRWLRAVGIIGDPAINGSILVQTELA